MCTWSTSKDIKIDIRAYWPGKNKSWPSSSITGDIEFKYGGSGVGEWVFVLLLKGWCAGGVNNAPEDDERVLSDGSLQGVIGAEPEPRACLQDCRSMCMTRSSRVRIRSCIWRSRSPNLSSIWWIACKIDAVVWEWVLSTYFPCAFEAEVLMSKQYAGR